MRIMIVFDDAVFKGLPNWLIIVAMLIVTINILRWIVIAIRLLKSRIEIYLYIKKGGRCYGPKGRYWYLPLHICCVTSVSLLTGEYNKLLYNLSIIALAFVSIFTIAIIVLFRINGVNTFILLTLLVLSAVREVIGLIELITRTFYCVD